jgi:hypothetical protein
LKAEAAAVVAAGATAAVGEVATATAVAVLAGVVVLVVEAAQALMMIGQDGAADCRNKVLDTQLKQPMAAVMVSTEVAVMRMSSSAAAAAANACSEAAGSC